MTPFDLEPEVVSVRGLADVEVHEEAARLRTAVRASARGGSHVDSPTVHKAAHVEAPFKPVADRDRDLLLPNPPPSSSVSAAAGFFSERRADQSRVRWLRYLVTYAMAALFIAALVTAAVTAGKKPCQCAAHGGGR